MHRNSLLTIGQVATRTGLSVASLRFYEERKLIRSIRTAAGHRQFRRADIRRVSFIKISQNLGFTLTEIGEMLASLPVDTAPNKADWNRLSRKIRSDLDARIADLEAMRDRLDRCIGCGCLSLKSCTLYNRKDKAAREGPGAQYFLETPPPD